MELLIAAILLVISVQIAVLGNMVYEGVYLPRKKHEDMMAEKFSKALEKSAVENHYEKL